MTPTGTPRERAAEPLLDDAQRDRLAEVLRADLEVLEQIPSTNDELVARAQAAAHRGRPLPDLSLLAAEHQSAGRGRLDRVWVTQPGDALTFSLLLRPTQGSAEAPRPLATQHFPWLTVLLAAAVAETLRAQDVPATLKWPNDVLVDTADGPRKICGLLASLVVHDGLAPALVLGAGLNVEDAPEGAASVRAQGSEATRGRLLVEIAERFTGLYRVFTAEPAALTEDGGDLRARIEPLMATLGQRVRAELPGDRPPLEGIAAGLDARGSLIIDDGARRTAVSAGDVVHLRPAAQGAGA